MRVKCLAAKIQYDALISFHLKAAFLREKRKRCNVKQFIPSLIHEYAQSKLEENVN